VCLNCNSEIIIKILVMGTAQNFLTRIGSGQTFVSWVGSGQPYLVWVWIRKIYPKNVKKMSSGRVEKYPGQSQVSLLFTAGQRVGLGAISTRYTRGFITRSDFLNFYLQFT